MGLFSTKTKSTSTPIVPGYIEGPVSDIFGRAQTLGADNPYGYIAPAAEAQTAANDRALGLGGNQGLFDEAASGIRDLMTSGPASASSGQLGDVSKYFNPFQHDVVNSTLDTLNRQGDRTVQGTKLNYAGPNYGNNASVAEALTRGEVQNGINSTISGLNLSGWNSAAGLAEGQAGRDQQTNTLNAQLAQQDLGQKYGALGQLGALGATAGDSARSDVGTLLDTGGTLRDVNQDWLNAPWTALNNQAGIFGSLMNPLIGQKTVGKTSGGLGNQLLDVGGKVASAFAMSDVRLKRDIERIGTRPDGLGVYVFRYLWSPMKHIGVMAQEVLKVKPSAVARHSSGFLMVDYGAL